MARQYVINTGSVTLVANTVKYVLELPTSATAGLTHIGFELLFARSITTPTQALVEWCTFGTTGTGTAKTPQQFGVGQGVAANVGSVKVNNSVAPTTIATAGLPSWRLVLPSCYSVAFPNGREMFQPASTNWCLRVTQVAVAGTPAPQDQVVVNVFVEQ